MQRSARDFLGHGVADATVVFHTGLDQLAMPPYLDILTYLLAREGIQYVHFAYAEESLLIGSRVGWRRLFRITSFVWRDQLYIARHNFSEDTLSQWPLDLQRIWRDITVDVPE